jgi:HD superfamily phosphohydrolase
MSSPAPASVQIRDPIHGTLQLSREELAVVDHPAFQRLRMIKQLGLADLAFPGATHTRYAHGLGTRHIASRMFQALERHHPLPGPDAARLHQALRLAALFHDLGHAPLSHTTERFMPPVGALGLGRWQSGPDARPASHEDYTLGIVTGSDLARVIERRFADLGVEPDDVATLIAGRAPDARAAARFVVGGVDWLPVLCQCVSSELDADRMDYLLRDSYFAGVPYGRYDLEWLLDHIVPVVRGAALHLGLGARASFAFEDFLLSRYHMFMSVYFHHVPIGYEVMLERYHAEAADELALPASVEAYLGCDDVFLHATLRASRSGWARRIVERRAYRLLVERREMVGAARGDDGGPLPASRRSLEEIGEALEAAGIPAIAHAVKVRLSRYFDGDASRPPGPATPALYIVDDARALPVEDYTPLYRRYAGAILLGRVYVDPARLDEARALLARLG